MSRVRLFRAVLFVALVALAVVPAGALGGKPERFHERVVEVFTGENVCGSTFDVSVSGVFTDLAFFDKEGNFVRFMSLASFRAIFSNDDGDRVVLQNAGMFQEVAPVVDEQAGTITFTFTFKGLPEMIKTAQGPLRLRDAGIATFTETFSLATGELLSSSVTTKGPHPELDSDFTLFCEAFLAAAG